MKYALNGARQLARDQRERGYHPMHLHGFYFTVNARGDAQADTVMQGSRPLLVTEGMRGFSSVRLLWTADRFDLWDAARH
ncbi:MAG: multicopper oxidase domain-containing protein [Gemmatimonadaceae bacterium]